MAEAPARRPVAFVGRDDCPYPRSRRLNGGRGVLAAGFPRSPHPQPPSAKSQDYCDKDSGDGRNAERSDLESAAPQEQSVRQLVDLHWRTSQQEATRGAETMGNRFEPVSTAKTRRPAPAASVAVTDILLLKQADHFRVRMELEGDAPPPAAEAAHSLWYSHRSWLCITFQQEPQCGR